MKVSVIGAGNGGQALAGWIAAEGHEVILFDRDANKTSFFRKHPTIHLQGKVDIEGTIKESTADIHKAVEGIDLIMVATTATAHRQIASQIAGSLKDGQVIVLNPGRTGGALEFRNALIENGLNARIYLAEAQTLVFACRIIENGKVNIIGIKDHVLISAIPNSDTEHVIKVLSNFFKCFFPAKNVLQTSLENIGAMFHPPVVLFNEAAIERGNQFYFYRDMTDGLAGVIESLDKERLAVANAYGITPLSTFDWVSFAYSGVKGDNLCERMQNNPAYYEILAPRTIFCRQITEDIPTGIIPIAELGKVAGVPTPLCDSIETLCSTLLKKDFRKNGRTLSNLGLKGMSKEEILNFVGQ